MRKRDGRREGETEERATGGDDMKDGGREILKIKNIYIFKEITFSRNSYQSHISHNMFANS